MPAHLWGPEPNSKHAHLALTAKSQTREQLPPGSHHWLYASPLSFWWEDPYPHLGAPSPTPLQRKSTLLSLHLFCWSQSLPYKLKEQTLKCSNLVFEIVDKECRPNLFGLTNFLMSWLLVFWFLVLLVFWAWRGGFLLGWCPGSALGDCGFLPLSRNPRAFPDILPLLPGQQGHFSVKNNEVEEDCLWLLLLALHQAVRGIEEGHR